jgi:hypothetical protein
MLLNIRIHGKYRFAPLFCLETPTNSNNDVPDLKRVLRERRIELDDQGGGEWIKECIV